MTRCSNCGEDGLRDSARFCDNCGAELVTGLDEGTTLAMPELEVTADEGATKSMPEPEIMTGDRKTRFMPTDEAAVDSSTRPAPEAEINDQGASKAKTDTQPKAQAAPLKSPDFKTGHIVQDRYRLDKALGRGGFGAAYLAEDMKLKRRCVVKQMLVKRRSTKELEIYRANFEREAKLLVELNDPGHANIPEIYDYFSDNSGNYLVMKYIEGRSLKDALEQSQNKLPWREAIRYAVDVCSALNYMHTRSDIPAMHRDIKPANILLGDDGRVWLVDFGLAKANLVESSSDLGVTQPSGSLGYTPLEQWLGQAVPASDIYALGVTLHYLVSGLDPLVAYGGEFHVKKLQERHGQFPPLRQIDGALPKGLEEIVNRATAAEPEQRPTALQLQQQLEVLISGAQGVALYTFKNGKSATSVTQLVNLCEQNRREAEAYLYNGDFERWFLLINRNDLAEAAAQAIKQGKNQKDGLEKFLKLIIPNLLLRRLGRASMYLTRGALQFGLSAIVITFLLAISGSYMAGLFIRQSIATTSWDFYALDFTGENSFTEANLTDKFRQAAGPYLGEVKVKVRQAQNQIEINSKLNSYPLKVTVRVAQARSRPYFYGLKVNDIPLLWIGDNISQGINQGVDQVFQASPVDLSHLLVLDGKIIFNVKDSQDPARPPLGTPTPAPTSTPTPTATPTLPNLTLVVVFNKLKQDIILQIDEQKWPIAADDTQVLELPPGTYYYVVQDKGTEEIIAQGTKIWTLNRAYRLRIGQ